MRRFITVFATCIFSLSFYSCSNQSGPVNKKLETPKDTFSYAIGLEIGVSLEQMQDEIDLAAVFMGITDTLEKKGNRITAEEAQNVKKEIFQQLREKQMADQKVKGDASKKAGETFLTENKSKEGVVTTESGLQYIVLKEGTGQKPKATDKVKVHYAGTLIDGKEFDSSYKRGQPTEFTVGGVIKGWGEALQLMKTGSKYKLFIPPALAYGERGAGGAVPPNATLIFEVELLEIVK